MTFNIQDIQRTEPLRVLLADDNDDDIMLIRRAFADAGVPVELTIARDGEEVFTHLRGNPVETGDGGPARPELILLDINMPRKDGFETLGELKADTELNSIPVIIMTTSNRNEDIKHSYANGACSFITKPRQVEDFKRIAQVLWVYWASIVSLPTAS